MSLGTKIKSLRRYVFKKIKVFEWLLKTDDDVQTFHEQIVLPFKWNDRKHKLLRLILREKIELKRCKQKEDEYVGASERHPKIDIKTDCVHGFYFLKKCIFFISTLTVIYVCICIIY